MPSVKYIGESETYKDAISNNEIALEKDKYYNIDIRMDGPQMIINGQPVIHPDSTLWVDIDNDIHIPYAPNLINNFWEGIHV